VTAGLLDRLHVFELISGVLVMVKDDLLANRDMFAQGHQLAVLKHIYLDVIVLVFILYPEGSLEHPLVVHVEDL